MFAKVLINNPTVGLDITHRSFMMAQQMHLETEGEDEIPSLTQLPISTIPFYLDGAEGGVGAAKRRLLSVYPGTLTSTSGTVIGKTQALFREVHRTYICTKCGHRYDIPF